MKFSVFSKNGVLLPIGQATVPLHCIEYMYGLGVYETIRSVKGKARFLSDHVARLLHSASIIKLEHPFDTHFINGAIVSLVSSLGTEVVCNLKVLLIGGPTTDKAQLIVLPLASLFADKKLYRDGVKTTSVSYERFLPQAKTLNMLPSYLYYREAKMKGCYDALLVNHKKEIVEGTRTNFFCIRGKEIFTPPFTAVLAGITRKYVMQVARDNGFAVHERSLSLSDIGSFDGAFLTGTSVDIMPIKSIDDFVYPQISVHLRELMQCYQNFKDSV